MVIDIDQPQQTKDIIEILNTHLKDLFFRGFAVAPIELMHS